MPGTCHQSFYQEVSQLNSKETPIKSDTEHNIDFDLDDISEVNGIALRVVLATIARLAMSLRRSTTH